MSKWQPIETAPKDGTLFLVFKLEEGLGPVFDIALIKPGTKICTLAYYNLEPSHWMELPAPPVEEK